jgi:hypothetical protein
MSFNVERRKSDLHQLHVVLWRSQRDSHESET